MDGLADDVEGEVLQAAEADAGLAHVQAFRRRSVGLGEPRGQQGVGIEVHAGRREEHAMIRGFVLVETEVGRTLTVARHIRQIASDQGRVTAVDTVTGPFDVIVQVEAEDLDALGRTITAEIATAPGVQRTTTCLAVNLG